MLKKVLVTSVVMVFFLSGTAVAQETQTPSQRIEDAGEQQLDFVFPVPATVGERADFYCDCDFDGATFCWDFDGDGKIDIEAEPDYTGMVYVSHTYKKPGTYKATLVVKDEKGNIIGTKSKEVFVNPKYPFLSMFLKGVFVGIIAVVFYLSLN